MSDSISRRLFMTGAAAAAGAAAGAFGYRSYAARKTAGYDSEVSAFREAARRIREAKRLQTVEHVKSLKARYEGEVFGKMRVMEFIEKLGRVVDPSDPILLATSQIAHEQQMIAQMEKDGVVDPDMYVAALLHDAGKALLLWNAAPSDVVGVTGNIGRPTAGAGLDAVVFQFGHPEFIWMRLKDHVSEPVAWLLRYHGIVLAEVEPFMNERDRAMRDKYLVPFRKYDLYTKSNVVLPPIDWRKYEALIEERFPTPILF